MKDVFNNLRVYGDVVINFGLVKQAGLRKYIGNVAYYYFLKNPTILFSIDNSFVTVYRNVNGMLVPIPP
jgi:hypothetical protein